MSNYSSLKATINANVKTNGNQEITGQVMNAVLNAMVNSLGSGYQYMGIATPTNPGTNQTPDDRCFYIATTPGTYSHLGGLVVNDGEVAILKYDSAWSKEVTGAATAAQVTQLGRELGDVATLTNTWNATGVIGNLSNPLKEGDVIQSFSGANWFIIYENAQDTTGTQIMASSLPYTCTKAYTRAQSYASGSPEVVMTISRKGEIGYLKDDILRIDNEIATINSIVEQKPSFVRFTQTANGGYSGNVGETISEVSNAYRGRFTRDLQPNTEYALCDVREKVWITDEDGVILQKFVGTENARNIFRFNSGLGTKLYAESYRVDTVTLWSNVNNHIVLGKGNKVGYTLPSTLSRGEDTFMGDKPYILPMSGTSSITLSLSSVSRNIGVWLSIGYFDFDNITTMQVDFKTGDSVTESFTIKPDGSGGVPALKSRSAITPWAFIAHNEISEIDSIVISWSVTSSINIRLAPWAVGDFLIMPTVFYNFEHWETNARTLLAPFVEDGIKLSMTGRTPTDSDDIAWVRENANKGLLDFGIYGNENNDTAHSMSDTISSSLRDEYAMSAIADKCNVVTRVTTYGAVSHNVTPKAVATCRDVNLPIIRICKPDGSLFPFIGSEDFLPANVGYACISSKVVKLGLIGNFVHTADFTTSSNVYTDLPKVKNLIANHCLQCVTMQELWTKYRDEFIITK